MSEQAELYSLLIPLREDRLLVPRMCVAEVAAYTEPERGEDEDLPDWLLGTIEWNARRLPIVTLDRGAEAAGGRKPARRRIVVFHAVTDHLPGGHYGVVTQGFPQLVRVNRDVISLDRGASISEDDPVLCRVRMIHEYPLIPDVERVERMIAQVRPDRR